MDAHPAPRGAQAALGHRHAHHRRGADHRPYLPGPRQAVSREGEGREARRGAHHGPRVHGYGQAVSGKGGGGEGGGRSGLGQGVIWEGAVITVT